MTDHADHHVPLPDDYPQFETDFGGSNANCDVNITTYVDRIDMHGSYTGTLTIDPGMALTTNNYVTQYGFMDISPGATLNVHDFMTVNGAVTDAGSLIVHATLYLNYFPVVGTVTPLPITIGALDLYGFAQSAHTMGDFDNSSNTAYLSAGGIDATGKAGIEVQSGWTLDLDAPLIGFTGTLQVDDGAELDLVQAGNISFNGTLNMDGGAILELNGGTLYLNTAGTLHVDEDGAEIDGTFQQNGSLVFTELDNSADTLWITGDHSLEGNAGLVMTTWGNGKSDSIQVAGKTDLGDPALHNGLTVLDAPTNNLSTVTPGYSNALITSQLGMSGDFHSMSGPALPNGFVWGHTAPDVTGSKANYTIQVVDPPPVLDLGLTQNPDFSVTLSGTVTAYVPGGLTVSFSGMVNGSTVTNPDGSFSLTTTPSGDGPVDGSTTDIWGTPSNTAVVNVAFPPPVITSLLVTGVPNAGHTVAITGTLTDTIPSSVTVAFGGMVSGSTTADASGNFSLDTTLTDFGLVSAQGTDGLGLISNLASVNVTAPAAPTINLNLGYGEGKTVTLSGTVTDYSPGGLTVTFSGEVTGSTVTNPDGSYSYTGTATGLGPVYASTADVWGQPSNTAEANVSPAVPVVALNLASVEGTTVTLTGTVTSPFVGHRAVTFGGEVSDTVATNPDGTFSYTGTAAGLGTITALTTDPYGQTSNTASVNLTSAAPAITLSQTPYYQGNSLCGYFLSGSVTAPSPGGLTVTFSGGTSATTATNADGTFSWLMGIVSGPVTVNATTEDVWGQLSNTASVTVGS